MAHCDPILGITARKITDHRIQNKDHREKNTDHNMIHILQLMSDIL